MSRIRNHFRRALTDPAWLRQAFKTAYRLWQEQGMLGILAKMAPQRFSAPLYRRWLFCYPLPPAPGRPLRKISLLLATDESYPPELVVRTVESVVRQTHRDWELLVASPDGDIRCQETLGKLAGGEPRLELIKTPNGMAEQWNALLDRAATDIIIPLSPRHALHPELLAYVSDAFSSEELLFLFTDTDRIDDRLRRHTPDFRHGWDAFMARARPDYAEFAVVRKELLAQLGGFSRKPEDACRYDLVLGAAEKLQDRQIRHIPMVLAHRQDAPIAGGNKVDFQSCLEAHFQRFGIAAEVCPLPGGTLSIRFAVPTPPPSVAIIMPTRDGGAHLRKAAASVLQSTSYPNFTLYIVDNDSGDPDTLAQLELYARDPRCRIIRDPRPFNYAAINNRAVAQTEETLICFLNDDVEVLAPDWLSDLVGAVLLPGVGAAGARLWYPDGALQHAGVILGYGGGAGHARKFHRRRTASEPDPTSVMREFSAVTAACLVTRRTHFEAVGGFDEVHFPVNFNDVDFCLKLKEAGHRILYVPSAQLIHHESATRGTDRTPAQIRRYAGEIAILKERWRRWIADDPAYNPNLTLRREDYSLAWPPRWHLGARPPS